MIQRFEPSNQSLRMKLLSIILPPIKVKKKKVIGLVQNDALNPFALKTINLSSTFILTVTCANFFSAGNGQGLAQKRATCSTDDRNPPVFDLPPIAKNRPLKDKRLGLFNSQQRVFEPHPGLSIEDVSLSITSHWDCFKESACSRFAKCGIARMTSRDHSLEGRPFSTLRLKIEKRPGNTWKFFPQYWAEEVNVARKTNSVLLE